MYQNIRGQIEQIASPESRFVDLPASRNFLHQYIQRMKCNKSEKTNVNRLNTHLAHDKLILDSGIISNTNTP